MNSRWQIQRAQECRAYQPWSMLSPESQNDRDSGEFVGFKAVRKLLFREVW
jgi:hypothetical protein